MTTDFLITIQQEIDSIEVAPTNLPQFSSTWHIRGLLTEQILPSQRVTLQELLTMSTDPPANSDSTHPVPASAPTPQPPAAVMPRRVVRQERQVRGLILDYALGTSILGLIPLPRLFTLKLLLAFGLILKMIWDIGKLWRFRKGQDLLAIAGVFFGVLGALAMAFTAWLTFFGLGVFVFYLKSLAFAAALFTLPWGIGQTVNQFYASGEESGRRR